MTVLVLRTHLPEGFDRNPAAWGRLWRAAVDRDRRGSEPGGVIVAGPEEIFEAIGPLPSGVTRVKLESGEDWRVALDGVDPETWVVIHDLSFPSVEVGTLRSWLSFAADRARPVIPLRRISDGEHPARMATRWFRRTADVWIEPQGPGETKDKVAVLAGLASRLVPGRRYWVHVQGAVAAARSKWILLPLRTFVHSVVKPLRLALAPWGGGGMSETIVGVEVDERDVRITFGGLPGADRYFVMLMSEEGIEPEVPCPFVVDGLVKFDVAAHALTDAASGKILAGRQDLPPLWERAGRCAAGTAGRLRNPECAGSLQIPLEGPAAVRVDDRLALARNFAGAEGQGKEIPAKRSDIQAA